MPEFIVNRNAQNNGDHEVHEKDSHCANYPILANRMPLGWHAGCTSAVTEAKKTYPQSNGCAICAKACHTG
ncbi:hypothetical protein [Novosphingopyxis baekryungensis]|uniref:hypothetical protein n=1 Tax=Novosphingopyxis baekryungensis TaxID=279369 RepID=UPI0003B5F378|nr:hypothetical protein [Novosphingopyxis baekryungensis]